MIFGPEYPKIQTLYKRDDRHTIIPGDWTAPEFEYLQNDEWSWTEKVDGTNIRLHWDGTEVRIGGRTDNADVPLPLRDNLEQRGLFDPFRWHEIFGDAEDVTVYGEGYGPKIQSGGQYRADQSLVVFDVLVETRWLQRADIEDVAVKLHLGVVPVLLKTSLNVAADTVHCGGLESTWPGAKLEGLVGRPAVDLFNRRGERILAKIKHKDFLAYDRKVQEAHR